MYSVDRTIDVSSQLAEILGASSAVVHEHKPPYTQTRSRFQAICHRQVLRILPGTPKRPN